MILPPICNGSLYSSLKQVMLEQSGQNGHQTLPFGVYIQDLMFVSFRSICSNRYKQEAMTTDMPASEMRIIAIMRAE